MNTWSSSGRTVGRFAPSPTGLMHLGNAWSFFLAWLGARSAGGRVILRHEDIDTDRSRTSWMDAMERDLSWLGLDWDEGSSRGPHAPYHQSLCDGKAVRLHFLTEIRGETTPRFQSQRYEMFGICHLIIMASAPMLLIL